MKLRNKETGEIYIFGETQIVSPHRSGMNIFHKYNSLAELNSEWEDIPDEEPETFWYMTAWGDVKEYSQDQFAIKQKQALGNYFSSREEAEKAVEKLKAWKRLKDHNLRVERGQRIFVNADNKLTSQKPLFVVDTYEEVEDDLDLLFGVEK